MLIDVKQAVVHGNCVGAIYHILCGRADRQVKSGTQLEGCWLAVHALSPCRCAQCNAPAAGSALFAAGTLAVGSSCRCPALNQSSRLCCCPCRALQAAELRALAIFQVDPASGLITSSNAVVHVLSGTPEDECLPTLMPAQ